MASLDVKSLFTFSPSIPLEETTSVCCDSLFSNDAKVNKINRIYFEKLLRATLQDNVFNFEGKIYKQIDRVAMGYPLGHTLANLASWMSWWIQTCILQKICWWYICFFFRAPDHLEKFKNYLNSKQRNIRFTSNKEKNNFMPFLDNLITRTSNGF